MKNSLARYMKWLRDGHGASFFALQSDEKKRQR
jgi:hypothetical protein